MGQPIQKLTLRGFKSIRSLEAFEFCPLNVLIGANGAGKSNFVDFFRLLRAMADGALQRFVNHLGGGDGFFFLGPQVTRQIAVHLEFGENVYEFDLEPTADGGLQIADERVQYTGGHGLGTLKSIGSGLRESRLRERKDDEASSPWGGKGLGVPGHVYRSVSSWTVYHFHDTSILAPVRREQSARDFEQLRPDASNLAAFLLHLREKREAQYALIRDTVRMIAPFFDDFLLRPENRGGEEKIRLEWHQRESDFPFQAIHLSDGTLRFICLATALLQPGPPSAVVIDEPELGLHPYALNVLAGLIRQAATRTQVIVSTQSAALLDQFEPEDVVVVDRKDGASEFRRLRCEVLKEWLSEYSLGELWRKNVLEGGPAHE